MAAENVEVDAAAPSTTVTNATSDPGPQANTSPSKKPRVKTRVALMKYQFGTYDYAGVNEEWRIPEFEKYEVHGFFYSNKGLLKDEDIEAMGAHGWKSIIIDLAPGTPYVASERVTSKITKWGVPKELRAYDFVLTHDCDVHTDYAKFIPYVIGHMEEHETNAFFQRHERKLSCVQEIDLFLREKQWRISTSRDNCIAWKAEIEEKLSLKYDLSAATFIKTNCFAFRPNDPAFLKAGEATVEKCHKIQRDQFIVCWAVQEYGVKYSMVDEAVVVSHGFDKPKALRDERTGIWN